MALTHGGGGGGGGGCNSGQLQGARGGGLGRWSRWRAGEETRWCLLAMALDATLDAALDATLDAVLVLAGLGNVTDPLDRLVVGLFEDL